MIKIRYCGRMGNSLLQYAYARILAKELNQYLPAHPIKGYLNTYKDVNIDQKNSKNSKTGRCLLLTRKNLWDIDSIKTNMENRNDIYIRSSCANYKNFVDYKDEIRKDWFCVDQPYDKDNLSRSLPNKFHIWDNGFQPIAINNIGKDDLMISLRLSEILRKPHRSRLLLFDYFDIILRNIKINRLFITSDSIENPLLRLFDKYNPIHFFQSDYMETLNLIRLFNRIAISQSSYSWWAAYLSDAEEIYFPITQQGPWVLRAGNDEDLRVDEERYIYVDHKSSKIIGNYKNIII